MHAFTADGLPSRTTLASGRWTQNAYDADRRLSATTDSDGNSVQYAYDAFGRLASATDAAGHAETFARDALGRVTNETQTVFDELFWTNRTAVLDRPLDAFGRPAGLSLKIDGDFAQSICYDYGVDGHLSGMVLTNAQGRSVSVEYDWEQGRFVGSTVFDSSGDPIFARTVSRAPRRPALVTAITNAGFEPLTSNLSSRTFSYAYDAVGRPVERGADAFAYNARGEVTNATISGATWGYAYDHIGNREAATAPSGTTAYAANALNQYAAVTGRSVAHDADGNMTRNGERNQTWDAAGRLVKSSPDLVQRWQTWQDFDYDYRGRRTAKYTQIFFGGIAPPVDTHLYFYDDWNLVHETTISDTYQIKHVDYFWGPDLSGTLQGAGGVGGLVAVSIDGFFYFPGYDNNGNSLVAEYSYDAFGNTISSSGSMASVFPHRFSTKYYDAETDLYYYGYRYYSPSLGRWISRDPIGETGGNNLLVFCENNPFSKVDPTGEKVIVLLAVDEAFSEATLSLEIDVANEIKKWRKEFKNFRFRVALLHRNRFQELVKAGCVTFDEKPFNGSRDEYLSLIDNELRSTIVRLDPDENTMDNFGELVRKAVEYPSYLHDRLVIVTHGTGSEDEVWFSSHTTERGRFEELVDRNMRSHFQGQLIFVFCYRTGIGAEKTEGFYVLGSKPVPDSGSPRGAITKLSFYPFAFYHGIGTGSSRRE